MSQPLSRSTLIINRTSMLLLWTVLITHSQTLRHQDKVKDKQIA